MAGIPRGLNETNSLISRETPPVSEEASMLSHRCMPGENNCNLDLTGNRHFYLSTQRPAKENDTDEVKHTNFYYVVVVRENSNKSETMGVNFPKRSFTAEFSR